MGSRTGEGGEGRIPPVLLAGHGVSHKVEVSVRVLAIKWWQLPHSRSIRRQPGQTATSDVAKRDLRAELILAEQEAREKKRKAEGKPGTVLAVEDKAADAEGDEANKRRKLLQQALELDKDDDDDDDADKKSGGEDKEADKADADDECVALSPTCYRHAKFLVMISQRRVI